MSSPFPLPSIRTLARTRRTLSAAHLDPGEHAEALGLVQAAAERGDNVGRDEFPSSLAPFGALLKSSEALGLRDLASGRLEALLLVTPCKPARSIAPTVCTLHVITSPPGGRELWADLTRLGEQFVRGGLRGEPGRYSGVTQLVFVHCVERLMALRDEGFLVAACVPLAGELSGHMGHSASYILYKDLGLEALAYLPLSLDPSPSSAPIASAPGTTPPPSPRLRTVPFLPLEATLIDGTPMVYRALTHADIDDFYAAFLADINRGHGYGMDELPTRDFFIGRYVDDWHTIVAALPPPSCRVIGYTNFGPSSYARSAHPVIADGNIIVAEEYRGRGLSRNLLGVFAWGVSVSGYRGVQAEWSMDNLPSAHLGLTGTVANGVLPKGIFYRGQGWMDSCMAYQSVDLLPPVEVIKAFVVGQRRASL